MPRSRNKKSSSLSGNDIPNAPKRTYTTISCRPPPISNHCCIRQVVNSTVTATVATAVTTTYYFSLNQTYTAMTSVFDRYMIEAIRFSISPQQNAIGGLGAGLTDLYCVIDYDDANALTLATSQSSINVIKLSPGESLQRTFKPALAVSLYNSSFTGFGSRTDQWVDSASTSVQHYGVKLYIPPTNNIGQTNFQIWDVQAEYFVRFKNAF